VKVISQLAQNFLRDPEVREAFYEGGKRTLSYAYYVGLEPAAIAQVLEENGYDVWSIAELLERRAATEPATLDVDAIWSEGVVDRYGAYEAQVGADVAWAEMLDHGRFAHGLSSASYRVLGRLGDPNAFAPYASRSLLESLTKAVIGPAKHPHVARRLIDLATSEPFDGVLLYDWAVEELQKIVPEDAARLPVEEAYVPPPPVSEPPPSPSARWSDLARARERDDEKARSILLEVLGEVFGTFPPAAPSDPELASAVEEAVAAPSRRCRRPRASRCP